MHGRFDTERVAARRDPNGPGAGCRQAERADAGRPVVACRALHGAGLAHPAEPADRSEATAPAAAPDVGSVRAARGRDRVEDGGSGVVDGMAPLGDGAGYADAALCSEGEAGSDGTPVSVGGVLRMLDRQQFRCALSGRSLTPETAALDHVVPVGLGGKHVLENVEVLHKDVNRAKGSMPRDEFIGLCTEVVRWSGTADSNAEGRPGSAQPARHANQPARQSDLPRGDVVARL
jgi:hypothetical protein